MNIITFLSLILYKYYKYIKYHMDKIEENKQQDSDYIFSLEEQQFLESFDLKDIKKKLAK